MLLRSVLFALAALSIAEVARWGSLDLARTSSAFYHRALRALRG